ncbi:nucleotidyl transferase AbiEii/AbiGii toxin family protein [Olleya sp.]|jgi:hypothetical protein|uniref:nucleotidyl transferase AbiEii/AbiGii toxin family protein n=1 Tax=Olleya sp. TaxID=1906788 RepID=UPI0032D9A3C7
MSAVTPVLLQTIKQLQALPSLSQFALAGGTNLAFRFNHRHSQDIDLFCPEIVGIKHFETIEEEVKSFFGETNITGLEYPFDKVSEQYTYVRFWITKADTRIKVEIIQNMKMMDAIEVVDEVRLVTTKDIGLFKLISGSSRAAKKDIYDLDFITENINVIELFEALKVKKQTFNQKEHQNIFDLDEEECPTQNPSLLLKFDGNVSQNRIKPMHSNDNILIVKGGKSWVRVRTSWRMKVRRLFNHLEIEYK